MFSFFFSFFLVEKDETFWEFNNGKNCRECESVKWQSDKCLFYIWQNQLMISKVSEQLKLTPLISVIRSYAHEDVDCASEVKLWATLAAFNVVSVQNQMGLSQHKNHLTFDVECPKSGNVYRHASSPTVNVSLNCITLETINFSYLKLIRFKEAWNRERYDLYVFPLSRWR